MGRYSGKTCRLLSMLVLTAIFFLVEIIVGYITNSIALVADSFHMLSDVVALIVGFSCVRIARWPSEKNTFGWIRAEVLGALVNSVFLLALCFSILVEALKRLVQVEHIDDPKLMLIVGGLGLVVNLIGLGLFHNHGHSHGGGGGGHGHSHSHGSSDSHGHSHESPVAENEALVEKKSSIINGLNNLDEDSDRPVQIEIENDTAKVVSQSQLNMRGVFLHVLGDALGSVIVIISALVIWFAEGDWKFYVDPVMSLLLVFIIIGTTLPLLRDSSYILLQAVPKHIHTRTILRKMEKLPGVLAIHEFHIWQLAGNRIVATAHIGCQSLQDYMVLAVQIKELFHNEGIHSTTIQPEIVEIGENLSKSSCILECQPNKNCITDTCCGPKTKSNGKSTSPQRKKDKNSPAKSQSEPNQASEQPDNSEITTV